MLGIFSTMGYEPILLRLTMMPRDFIRTQAKKTSGIVVQDVPFLLFRQKISVLDGLYCFADYFGPDHLIGAVHQALPQPIID